MIDACEWPLSIAAEQIKRPPAKIRGFGGPTAVEETAAVIKEAQPSFRRHVAQWFVRIEPGEAFGPSARCSAVVLDNCGALVVSVRPRFGRRLAIFASRERGC
jgi:hypothetical protein